MPLQARKKATDDRSQTPAARRVGNQPPAMHADRQPAVVAAEQTVGNRQDSLQLSEQSSRYGPGQK